MPSEQGRIIMSDVCVCSVCMNEEHEADIHIDGDTRLKGRIQTTWGDWQENSIGEKYRIG